MENKFSVVIPTLWKSNRIFQLVDDLHTTDKVGEIYIIDNSGEYDSKVSGFSSTDKIRVNQPESNLYVAASWNKGVENAQYEKIAILNDDINFSTSLFDTVDELMTYTSRS